MQRHVLNQYLDRAPLKAAMRKVIDLVHFKGLPAKTGISIFGSTLLVGTGFVFAGAQSAPATSSFAPLTTNSTPSDFSVLLSPILEAQQNSAGSNSSESQQTSTSSAQTNTSNSHTEVIVNGENISVPANGSVHRTVTNSTNNGTTTVDVTTQTSAQNGTHSYTNVQTNSFTSGTTNNFSNQTGVNN